MRESRVTPVEALNQYVTNYSGPIPEHLRENRKAVQETQQLMAMYRVGGHVGPGDHLALTLDLKNYIEQLNPEELNKLALQMVDLAVNKEVDLSSRARALEVIHEMGRRPDDNVSLQLLQRLGQISVEEEMSLMPYGPSTSRGEVLFSGEYRVAAAMIYLGLNDGCFEIAERLLIQRIEDARKLSVGEREYAYHDMADTIEKLCLGKEEKPAHFSLRNSKKENDWLQARIAQIKAKEQNYTKSSK